jgi:hypothetical protein
VFRLDRLARSGIRDLLEVVDQLRGAGVDLVTVAHGFDLEGPASEVVLAVMVGSAQMERLATDEWSAAARVRLETEGPTCPSGARRSRALSQNHSTPESAERPDGVACAGRGRK